MNFFRGWIDRPTVDPIQNPHRKQKGRKDETGKARRKHTHTPAHAHPERPVTSGQTKGKRACIDEPTDRLTADLCVSLLSVSVAVEPIDHGDSTTTTTTATIIMATV